MKRLLLNEMIVKKLIEKRLIDSLIVWGKRKAKRTSIETFIRSASNFAIQRPLISRYTYYLYKEASVVAEKILQMPFVNRFLPFLTKGISSSSSNAVLTFRHLIAQTIRINIIVVTLIFFVTSIPQIMKFKRGELSKKRLIWMMSNNILILIVGTIGSFIGSMYFNQYDFAFNKFIGGLIGCVAFTSTASILAFFIELRIKRSLRKRKNQSHRRLCPNENSNSLYHTHQSNHLSFVHRRY